MSRKSRVDMGRPPQCLTLTSASGSSGSSPPRANYLHDFHQLVQIELEQLSVRLRNAHDGPGPLSTWPDGAIFENPADEHDRCRKNELNGIGLETKPTEVLQNDQLNARHSVFSQADQSSKCTACAKAEKEGSASRMPSSQASEDKQESCASKSQVRISWAEVDSEFGTRRGSRDSGTEEPGRASSVDRRNSLSSRLPLPWVPQGQFDQEGANMFRVIECLHRHVLQAKSEKFGQMPTNRVGDMLKEESWLQSLVALPGSNFRIVWDITGVSFVAYDGFMIPFMQAFFKDEAGTTIAVLMLMSTIFWTLDIPMSFFLGYHSNGLIEMRVSQIAKRYSRTWFIPDLLIVLLDWLFILLGLLRDATTNKSDNSAGLARVLRTVRAFRMLRIVRLLRLPKLFRKVRELYARIRNDVLRVCAQVWGVLGAVVVTCHFVACTWHSIGTCRWGELKICDDTGPSWIKIAFDNDQAFDMWDRYWTSCIWSLGQFSMSSSEVFAQNAREKLFTFLIALLGLLVFSIFLGSVTTDLTLLRQINAGQYGDEESLKQFMADKKITVELGRCIMDFYSKYRRSTRQHVQEVDLEILSVLPVRLRVQLHVEMFTPVLAHHPFFASMADVNVVALTTICDENATDVYVRPQEDVFVIGEIPKGMYFITQGTMTYDIQATTTEFGEGTWISEPTLWIDKWTHRGRFTSCCECCLVRLDRGTLNGLYSNRLGKGADTYIREYKLLFCDHRADQAEGDFIASDSWASSAEIAAFARAALIQTNNSIVPGPRWSVKSLKRSGSNAFVS